MALTIIGVAHARDRLVVRPAHISCAPGTVVALEIVRQRDGAATPTASSAYRIMLRPPTGAVVELRKRIDDRGRTTQAWTFRATRPGSYRLTVTHRQGGVSTVVEAVVRRRIPIKSIRPLRVRGFELLPIKGPLTLKPGDRLALTAEARDDRGMTIAFRPHWELVEPYAGRLSLNPYSGVCTFTAGNYPSHTRLGFSLRVFDPRVPDVRAVVRLRIIGPIESGRIKLPDRLEAYLVRGRTRSLIGKRVALFARPGQVSRIEILGVFGDRRRPVHVTWSLPEAVGTVLRTGVNQARVIAGYTESRPKHPYLLRIYHHGDHRIKLVLPLVIER